MSTTFKIVNGQIDINAETGQVNSVQGNRKAAQDLAEVLLQDYDANTDFGSHLRAVINKAPEGAGDLFIHFYIADAVSKLQAKQQQDSNLTAAEQILQITELKVSDDGQGNAAFFLAVSTADGQAATVDATQLDQQYEVF